MGDYLIHYGVLGMKWGVRKQRPPSGRVLSRNNRYRQRMISRGGSQYHRKNWYQNASEEEITKERRKQNLKKVAIGAAVVAGAAYLGYMYADMKGSENVAKQFSGINAANNLGNKLANAPLDQLGNKNQVLSKGAEIHRIEWGTNNDLAGRDKLYMNPNKRDAQNYRAILGKDVNNKNKGAKYDITYKAKNDIVAPSERKRVMVFMQKMQDPKFREAFADDYKNYNRLSPFEKAAYKNMTEKDFFDPKHVRQYYKDFVGITADSNSKAGKMYRDELVRRGFNAFSDDNDAGFLAKTPMIAINPSDNLVIAGKDKIGMIDHVIDKYKVKDFRR